MYVPHDRKISPSNANNITNLTVILKSKKMLLTDNGHGCGVGKLVKLISAQKEISNQIHIFYFYFVKLTLVTFIC